jgi:hypothetical protein
MLSFVTSQAVALSQMTRKSEKPSTSESAPVVRRRKHLFARVFEALAESRMRKAQFEVQYHRSMWHPNHPSKE